MLRFADFLATLGREEGERGKGEEGKGGTVAVAAGSCQPLFKLFLSHGTYDSFLNSSSSNRNDSSRPCCSKICKAMVVCLLRQSGNYLLCLWIE